MKVEFIKPWKWAERGIHVHSFDAGQVAEVSDECGELALRLGVGKREVEKRAVLSIDAGKTKPPSSAPAGQVSGKRMSRKRKRKK